jgi:hypothetical protein
MGRMMSGVSWVVSLGWLFMAAAFAETWSGTVSDSMCGAKHAAASASDAACIKKCVKGGASAVLVSDGKVYQIAPNSQSKVTPLLGQKVTVTGKLDNDAIEIASAQIAKE